MFVCAYEFWQMYVFAEQNIKVMLCEHKSYYLTFHNPKKSAITKQTLARYLRIQVSSRLMAGAWERTKHWWMSSKSYVYIERAHVNGLQELVLEYILPREVP